MSTTGDNVVESIIKFVKGFRFTSYNRPLKVGVYELLEFPELGIDCVGKFDTGNNANALVLTYDEILHVSEKKEQIKWRLGVKEFTSTLLGKKYIYPDLTDDESNQEPIEPIETRYMIETDIKFNDELFSNMPVYLIQRQDKTTPVNVNAKFMKMAEIMVDPDSQFVVSDFEDGVYDPSSAVGNNEYGIIFH